MQCTHENTESCEGKGAANAINWAATHLDFKFPKVTKNIESTGDHSGKMVHRKLKQAVPLSVTLVAHAST